MGTDAALLTDKVVQNAYIVLAIELITLTQAVDYLKIQDKLSKKSYQLYKKIRSNFSEIVEDRVITSELENLLEVIKNNNFLE